MAVPFKLYRLSKWPSLYPIILSILASKVGHTFNRTLLLDVHAYEQIAYPILQSNSGSPLEFFSIIGDRMDAKIYLPIRVVIKKNPPN